jgi:Fe2+ transport system protein FeoA
MSGDDQELLSAMGLTDHCRLRICRVGEPCIIQVAATRLGLSSVMAGKIMVNPDTSGA